MASRGREVRMGNRIVVEVEATLKAKIVVEKGKSPLDSQATVREQVRRFVFEHPEELQIKSTYLLDCNDLPGWEPPKKPFGG